VIHELQNENLFESSNFVRKMEEKEWNPDPLSNNPTMAQITLHNEEVSKEGKAIIHSIHDVFINFLNLGTTWDMLIEEFRSSKRTRRIEVLNLRKEFEEIKMNESE